MQLPVDARFLIGGRSPFCFSSVNEGVVDAWDGWKCGPSYKHQAVPGALAIGPTPVESPSRHWRTDVAFLRIGGLD